MNRLQVQWCGLSRRETRNAQVPRPSTHRSSGRLGDRGFGRPTRRNVFHGSSVPARLELRGDHACPRVLNTRQEVRLLEEPGLAYEPDLVILNDFAPPSQLANARHYMEKVALRHGVDGELGLDPG